MKPSITSLSKSIVVAARASPLSRAQVEEVQQALRLFHPNITFQTKWVETTGDKDLTTSLRDLPQDNFFTKEIDEMLLSGACQIAIHSAKDLPDPLPKGLKRIALTKGVDPRDALVLKQGETLASLCANAKIATSSARRDCAIKQLRRDLTCVDIRGPIGKRLEKLENGEVDGVIIAKAALIRLKLDHVNDILLDTPVARYQGRLAVLTRAEDTEMETLFSCLNAYKVLHIGLEAELPFIETIPFPIDALPLEELHDTTHLIITSKMAAQYFVEAVATKNIPIKKIPCISVGKSTTARLQSYGFETIITAQEESSEGVVETLKSLNLKHAKVFWPHSAQSRSVITDFLKSEGVKVKCVDCPLYETRAKKPEPLPNLDDYDEIFFSSPSTVDAFLSFYKSIPKDKVITTQGKVTENYVKCLQTK